MVIIISNSSLLHVYVEYYCVLGTVHLCERDQRAIDVGRPRRGEASLHSTKTSLGSRLLYPLQGVCSSSECAGGPLHMMNQPTLYLVLTFG